jgi:hypothetical protein
MGKIRIDVLGTRGTPKQEFVDLQRYNEDGQYIGHYDLELCNRNSISKKGLEHLEEFLQRGCTIDTSHAYSNVSRDVIDQIEQLAWAYNTFSQREAQPTQ